MGYVRNRDLELIESGMIVVVTGTTRGTTNDPMTVFKPVTEQGLGTENSENARERERRYPTGGNTFDLPIA